MSMLDRILKRLAARRELPAALAGPTVEGGDFDVTGSGTWRADGTALHYVSGERAGSCRYQIEGDKLVLGGLPATKLAATVRCVLARLSLAKLTGVERQ